MTIPLPEFAHLDRHDLVPSDVRTEIRKYGYARAAEARREALEQAQQLCLASLRSVPLCTGNSPEDARALALAGEIEALKGTTP